MKLRIRDNTLRLRLSKPEVEQLNTSGSVQCRTAFPGGRALGYSVESTPASVTLAASLDDSGVSLRIPESQVRAWANSEQVSISEQQALDDGSVLEILVEKDFACLSPRLGEDEDELFPHPKAGSETC